MATKFLASRATLDFRYELAKEGYSNKLTMLGK